MYMYCLRQLSTSRRRQGTDMIQHDRFRSGTDNETWPGPNLKDYDCVMGWHDATYSNIRGTHVA